jgi:hypothetical protein
LSQLDPQGNNNNLKINIAIATPINVSTEMNDSSQKLGEFATQNTDNIHNVHEPKVNRKVTHL